MAFDLDIADPTGSGGTANIDFDLSLTDLNEEQEIETPSDTKPFDELLGAARWPGRPRRPRRPRRLSTL